MGGAKRYSPKEFVNPLRQKENGGLKFNKAKWLKELERETGIEPATFSLGRRQSIGNKEHSVSCISFWRLRMPGFQSFLCTRIKWSTNGAHEST